MQPSRLFLRSGRCLRFAFRLRQGVFFSEELIRCLKIGIVMTDLVKIAVRVQGTLSKLDQGGGNIGAVVGDALAIDQKLG